MELMHGNIQLKIFAISEIVGNKDVAVVILTDINCKMHIAVVCDNLMKQELQMRTNKQRQCEEMLPEVLVNLTRAQSDFDYEIVINDIVDGVYKASLVNAVTMQAFTMRAADAILLHLISKIPLYATPQLIKRQAIPVTPGSPAMALPYNALSDSMLFDAMQSAVEQERYEMASTIRDELKKRGRI